MKEQYSLGYRIEQYNLAIAICSKIGDQSGVYKYVRLLAHAVGASTLYNTYRGYGRE